MSFWLPPSLQPEDFLTLVDDRVRKYVEEHASRLPAFDPSLPLTVVSDYAGSSNKHSVYTFSYLFFQPERCSEQLAAIVAMRRSAPPIRRVRYNKLRSDRESVKRLATLMPLWLDLPGVLMNFAVDKPLPLEMASTRFWEHMHPEFRGRFEQFDRRVRPHLFFATSFASFGLSGMLREGQRAHWITDADDIIANISKQKMCFEIFEGMVGGMINRRIGSLWLNSTEQGPLLREDIASLPDVSAGSLADCLTKLLPPGRQFVDHTPIDAVIEPRAVLIHNELQRNQNQLCTWTFQLRHAAGRGLERVIRWYGGTAEPIQVSGAKTE